MGGGVVEETRLVRVLARSARELCRRRRAATHPAVAPRRMEVWYCGHITSGTPGTPKRSGVAGTRQDSRLCIDDEERCQLELRSRTDRTQTEDVRKELEGRGQADRHGQAQAQRGDMGSKCVSGSVRGGSHLTARGENAWSTSSKGGALRGMFVALVKTIKENITAGKASIRQGLCRLTAPRRHAPRRGAPSWPLSSPSASTGSPNCVLPLSLPPQPLPGPYLLPPLRVL